MSEGARFEGDSDSLVARVCEALRGYYLLGNEVFEAEGATFVRNVACPRRHDANFVTGIRCRTQPQVEHLLERVEREYARLAHRQFRVDPLTPPVFAACLSLDGVAFDDQLVMSLEGDLQGSAARSVDIRPVEDDEDWVDFAALQRADWDENLRKQGKPPAPDVTVDFLVSKRCKWPEAQFWIAYESETPVAYFSSWAAPNGVGVLEDLFTLPDHRHHGFATALLAHTVADVRRRGSGPVVLSAFVDDTPKAMYAALGFTPLYLQRIYHRRVER